jgi:hypothetical protein
VKRAVMRGLLAALWALAPLVANGAHTVERPDCWSVELGVYDQLENAERKLGEIDDEHCRISSADGRHQVLCGCYDSAEEARRSIEQWRARDISQGEFARLPGVDQAKVLRRRPFERAPKTEFSTELFGRRLTLGGELTLELEDRKDFAFGSEPDDLERRQLELELKAFYQYSDQSAIYLEIEGQRRTDKEPESGDEETESEWKRNEMWLYSGGWANGTVGFQLGRQNFVDQRTWWWDRELDAARLRYDTETMHFEIAVAQELARVSTEEDDIDPEQQDVLRIISSATWVRDKDHETSIFVLLQQDGSETEKEGDIVSPESEDESDLDAIWLGARKLGKYRMQGLGRLYYWLDVGLVLGTEQLIDYDDIDSGGSLVDSVEERDLRGLGLDLGAMWRTKLPGEMTFTLGYAAGSGDDDPDDDTDTAYRQTGLNRNDASFRGVNGFRYYGDLLRPELSNIIISTFGIGFHFLPESSLELVYHDYRQVEAADEISDARLDLDPTGEDEDIGSELDLIIGIEESANFTAEVVLSRFEAGDAFGEFSGETAHKASLELELVF